MLRRITTWRLWEMRAATIALVLFAELFALALVGIYWKPITLGDLGLMALLLSLCIGHSIYLQRSEGVRHMLSRPRISGLSDMLGTWTFPAAVLLPVPLVAVLVVVASLFQWPIRNFDRKATVYRYIYSQTIVVLAACLVNSVMRLDAPYVLLLIISVISYLGVGTFAVAMAIFASSSFLDSVKYVRGSNQRNELITIGLGLAQIVMWNFHVPLIWLSLPAVIGIQRWALREESVRKPEDAPEPIMTEKVWGTVAREVIRACTTASIIRVDTDNPMAARTIAQMQAGCDALGAVGEAGLAVLLADCPGANAESLALRLRSALTTAGVAASVAVAAKPRDGQVLEDLLAVAEAELITRDAATRSAKSLRPDA